MKKILVVLLTGSLIFANSAFAGRFGGGRSSGMQRSTSPSYSNTNSGSTGSQSSYSNSGNNAQPQQRSGMGAGTAALLGAAAGAAGGYMLGRNNTNNPNASGVVASTAPETRSSIPWGTIAILIIILALGLMFFRKKTNPRLSSGNPMNNFTPSGQNGMNMQNMNRAGIVQNNSIVNKQNQAKPAPEQMEKMPDGVETIYFLRQAKGMFLHIQSMNNPDNLSEIQKYMTTELFEATKNDVATNSIVADFPTLDCQLIKSETISGGQSADGAPIESQLIASVKFFGMVSEDPQQPPKPFNEIWNFVKSSSTNNRWIVAGIQQESNSN